MILDTQPKVKIDKTIEITQDLSLENSLRVKTLDGKVFQINYNKDNYQGSSYRAIDFEGTEKEFSEIYDKLLTLLIQAREEFNKN